MLAFFATVAAVPGGNPFDEAELAPDLVAAGRFIESILAIFRVAFDPCKSCGCGIICPGIFDAVRAERLVVHQNIEFAVMQAVAGVAPKFKMVAILHPLYDVEALLRCGIAPMLMDDVWNGCVSCV